MKVRIKKYGIYEGWELILNAFKSGIFPIKETQGKELKITPKQVLQRLETRGTNPDVTTVFRACSICP